MTEAAPLADWLSQTVVDVMDAGDVPFVLDSWLKTFATSPRGLRMDDYWKVQRETCERLLTSAETLVLRPKGWPEGILGWMCGERRGNLHAVHYAFTKNGKNGSGYRRLGVCSRLLAEQRGDAHVLVYTHLRPPYSAMLERRGYTYDRGLIAQPKSAGAKRG